MAAGYTAGWMPGDAYDALRAADFLRFCEAAVADTAAHVPTCPEWDVTALCDHLARVYQGRTFAIEHGAFLERDRFEVRADGADPLDFVRAWSDALDRALLERDDDAPTVTFMPEATTVHFWRRRMALETLVHRTDAEIAVGQVSPMDDDLSADGVDELLWFLTEDDEPPDTDAAEADASSVVLTDGSRTWPVTIAGAAADRGAVRVPDATVRGSAPALLLALSGRDLHGIGSSRFGVELPTVEGDVAAYDRLLSRLGGF